MEIENLRRRIQDGSRVQNTVHANNDDNIDGNNREMCRMERWRVAIARHGFWTMALAVAAPVSLLLLDVLFVRQAYDVSGKPWYITRAWMVDGHQMSSFVLVSLCSWFAWAENNGRFRWSPVTVATLYLGFVALSVAWGPIVLGLGTIRVAVFVTLARAGFVLAIGFMLKELNHTAGNVVIKAGGLLSYFVADHTREHLRLKN